MDHMKEALRKKMGKVITIKINVDDPEQEKKTDLAPEVKDSDEQGVVTSDDAMEGAYPTGENYADALIAQAPGHPASGKTLESIAKERAMKRRFKK